MAEFATMMTSAEPRRAEAATSLIAGSWDCCSLHGRPVETIADWLEVLETGSLASVRGAYALAWRDPASGVVHLVRDPIGERSLYYAADPDGVTVARTVGKVLAQRRARPRLDLSALATYLCLSYIPAPLTPVEQVHAVAAGEHVRLPGGTIERTVLWEAPGELPDPGLEPAAADLRGLLERSVSRRLPSPGAELCASLSGGLDSSLVVALAGRVHTGSVTAYSLGFGAEEVNELEYSAMVAEHCRVEHRVITVTPEDVLRELDSTMNALGAPIGDPLTVPNTILFRQADSVMFNGEGGDPCFGGPKNVPMLLHTLYRPVDGDGEQLGSAYLRAHRRCYDDLTAMVTDDVLAELPERFLESRFQPHLEDPRWNTLTNRMMAMNVQFKCADHILAKVDALARSAGAVPRSPLCDRELVEYALRLPAHLKLVGSGEKHVLKAAVADLLPEAILTRPKSGMRVPVVSWMNGPLLPYTRERLLDGLAPRGLFRKEYLERLVDLEAAPVRRRHLKLWMLLSLEAWLAGIPWK